MRHSAVPATFGMGGRPPKSGQPELFAVGKGGGADEWARQGGGQELGGCCVDGICACLRVSKSAACVEVHVLVCDELLSVQGLQALHLQLQACLFDSSSSFYVCCDD